MTNKPSSSPPVLSEYLYFYLASWTRVMQALQVSFPYAVQQLQESFLEAQQ